MPPFYPDQYQEQYPNQYPYDTPYNGQFNQYQYTAPSPSQPIPPFSQIRINVPPAGQQHAAQQQPQYSYNQGFQSDFGPRQTQYQYQYQSQPPYAQYQHQPPPQPQIQQQQYYQPMPQYQAPPHQLQVHIPRPPPQSSPKAQPPPKVLKDVQPTALRPQQAQIATPPPKKATPEEAEPDYGTLLLNLADEYLEAAQKLPVRSDRYFRLTSTALGCIETVLNNFKVPPLREAQLSLRYSQLLLNETENYDDAERILTKTVDQCERLKYHDLKYSGQLLLIRVLHQSRPKAALKDLQSMIQDIEAYKHTAWEYAFRLQYVMFVMSSDHPNDIHVAATQLERICNLARQSGDYAVLAFAAVLEALIYLHFTAPDSVQSSQQALANARALQLNPAVAENPQICLMMEFVDLCGQIKASKMEQSEQSRKTMQSVLYPALQKSAWRNDGVMYVFVSPSSLRGLSVQDGGLVVNRNGKHYLAFSWLPKDEVEDLGYLLSGVSAARKNAGDGGKADKFFDEGLAMIQDIQEDHNFANNAGDVMRTRQQLVQCHFVLEMAFLQCSKGQWQKAQASIKSFDAVVVKLEVPLPREMHCLLEYLKGAICQGRGDLDGALKIFQSPVLDTLPKLAAQPSSKPPGQLGKSEEVVRNISLLAAMNTIFIIQQPNHPQNQKLSSLLNTVDPLVSHNTNKGIQAAWNFVLASLPNNSILKTKQYLGSALSTAQSINNAQITTLCLVTMQEKFFKGVVGDQAIKCARAASHQAKRLNEPMWIAAASGLEAECLGLHGMVDDSAKKQEEMHKAASLLPDRVRSQMMAP